MRIDQYYNFINHGNIYRETIEYPYYRIIAPPEYVNMTTKEVLRTSDWTNPAVRNNYQELLLQENVDMEHTCLLGSNSVPVSKPLQGPSYP